MQTVGGLTVQQRLDDICKRQGMSEEIVRRVLKAERDSAIDSLKRGENATLIGRCVLKPDIRQKVEIGGQVKTYIKVGAEAAYAVKSELAKYEDFETGSQQEEDSLPEGIRVAQIQSLL